MIPLRSIFFLFSYLGCLAANGQIKDDLTAIDSWSTLSPSKYVLSSNSGTLKVDVSSGITFETFDYKFPEMNLKNNPYVQIDIRSAAAVTVRIDMLDVTGYTTNTTETKFTVPGNNTWTSYIFDFTGKFTQTYPSDANGTPFVVDATHISQISIFINPSTTASTFTGSVYFDNLKIGNTVVIPPPPSGIRVNQIGFYPNAPKIGVVAQIDALKFYVVSESGLDTVFTGDLPAPVRYAGSGELVSLANFSSVSEEGSYTLNAGTFKSPVFKIKSQVHNAVAKGLIKSFYFNRASTAISGAPAEKWPRPYFTPINDPDNNVYVHASAATASVGENIIISSLKGWFDAGDYNKYVVNAGITTYTMLSLYEHFPSYFDTLNTKIPESGAKLPDILDEAMWEIDWLLSTQTDDGSVYHKITELSFPGMNVMPKDDANSRFAVQRGTASACNFAAIMAQAYRILSNPAFADKLPFTGYADTLLYRAKWAYAWAAANPAKLVNGNSSLAPLVSTGTYGDNNVSDELAWARMELFISTKDPKYYVRTDAVSPNFSVPGYTTTNTLGLLSLVNYRADIAPAMGASVADTSIFKTKLLSLANSIRNNISAYGTPMGNTGSFGWGSNSYAGNQGMILLQAYRLTNNVNYLTAALSNLDYLLGRNATGYSFVTGYGTKTPMQPHHRISNADAVVDPIPGLVVGGANASPDPGEGVSGYSTSPARSYMDDVRSYSTNEPAINYTAANMYVANAIEAIMAGGVGNITPVVKGKTSATIAVNLYPVPSKEELFLEFKNDGTTKISILDVNGRILLQKNATEYGMVKESLNISGLNQGIYFINITCGDGTVTKKFVKN